MRAAIVMSGMSRKNERGEQVFLLPLEMAEKIVRHDGWDLARVQQLPVRRRAATCAARPRRSIPIVTGGAGYKMSLSADLGRRLADGDCAAL